MNQKRQAVAFVAGMQWTGLEVERDGAAARRPHLSALALATTLTLCQCEGVWSPGLCERDDCGTCSQDRPPTQTRPYQAPVQSSFFQSTQA